MNNLGIGCRSTNAAGTSATGGANKRMNDVRIYDHCLSVMEVKEISKGLVLHYPLSDAYVENTLNYLGEKSDTFTSWRSYGFGSKGVITIDTTQTSACGGQVAKLTNNTTETSNSTVEMATVFTSVASTVMQKNEKFTISAYVKGNGSTIGRYCYLHIDNTNGTNTSSTGGQPIILTDKWQRIIYTYTWPYDTASGNSGNCYVYALMKGGESIYICNVQVEKKDHATPFTNNSRISNIVYDTSGLCNNGTTSGTLVISNDTPKYQVSTKIAASASGIKLTNFSIGNIWSMSIWFKYPSRDNTGWKALVVLNNNGSDSDLQLGSYINCSDGRIQYSANGKYDSTSVYLVFGEWNHLVGTYDGTTLKCYLNGEYKTSLIPGQALSNRKNLGIGFKSNAVDFSTFGASMTNGLLSDVRIYATALSANDVKSLYNNSAYIDNQGNIYGAVYEEV